MKVVCFAPGALANVADIRVPSGGLHTHIVWPVRCRQSAACEHARSGVAVRDLHTYIIYPSSQKNKQEMKIVKLYKRESGGKRYNGIF